MSIKLKIAQEFNEAQEVLDNFCSESTNLDAIEKAANELVACFKNGGKVISCGNGGSMSDAMHFAEELSGRFREDRKALPALALSDPAFLTCAANDFGFELAFARGVEAFGKEGDVLLAISTSGNSQNVLHAAESAKSKGLRVIALTGKDGGNLAKMCDVEIRVPHKGYSDRIQEMHIKIIHILIMLVEERVK
ncbi:MAG: D-sedoheptulose 7-phosphate isomerase [Sphingobacteriales bacterium]|jgi:D-sedoheptulose 7-phosphate isomerase